MLAALLAVAALTLTGCATPGALCLPTAGDETVAGSPIDMRELFPPSDVLAYVDGDDEIIYVAAGREKEVARRLDARIDGDVWILKEGDEEVRRQKQELDYDRWYPRVAIVKWTYLRNMDCREIEAGTWMPVYRRRDGALRFHRSFQTTEKAWWCVTVRGRACRVVFEDVSTDFFTKPEGEGRRIRETRRLTKCAP
jgi:hypothetical protein